MSDPASPAPPGLRRTALGLFAVSFVVLFQELALIRWLPGQVRVLAYFPNLILLSAFLGLGLGCLRAGHRSLLWLWPTSLLASALAAVGLGRVVFTQSSATEHLYLLYYDLPRDAPVVGDVKAPILALFVLSTLSFVPLGQAVAERLQSFRERSSPLWGYAWDIGGSLAGVVAFTLVGFSGLRPVAWLGLPLAVGLLVLSWGRWSRLGGQAVLALGTLALVAHSDRADVHSPYYALQARARSDQQGLAVLANGSLHQFAFAVRRDAALPPELALTRDGYHAPYRRLARPPRRALVVGAGTGNDVSVLLDEGAEHIDAVEIDPAILALGRERHPERPYASPRVRTHNTDARSFLQGSREQYDLIVFGTLDSMTRLSALSTVRLDNFVYTLECLRAARARLGPEGGLVLYFMVSADYIDARLAGMVTEAFGQVPLVTSEDHGLFNRILMAGPAFEHEGGPQRRAQAEEALRRARAWELPQDDWPYLYLRQRGLSPFYVWIGGALAALAVLGVFAVSPDMRRSLRSGAVDLEMLLFGLGFLLLETRAVTAMNLLWGATWLTSAVVFGSILLVVLLATLATELRPPPYGLGLAGLVLSLLAAYAAPGSLLLQPSLAGKLTVSLLVAGGPVLFASVCFALRFRGREDARTAFGWNLLGAVAGGLLEMAAMVTGLRALLLVALLAYLGAALLWVRRTTGTSASSPAAATRAG